MYGVNLCRLLNCISLTHLTASKSVKRQWREKNDFLSRVKFFVSVEKKGGGEIGIEKKNNAVFKKFM